MDRLEVGCGFRTPVNFRFSLFPLFQNRSENYRCSAQYSGYIAIPMVTHAARYCVRMRKKNYCSNFKFGSCARRIKILLSIISLILTIFAGQSLVESRRERTWQGNFSLPSCRSVRNPKGWLCAQSTPSTDAVNLSVMISLFSDPGKYLNRLLHSITLQTTFCSKFPCETEILMVTDMRYMNNLSPALSQDLSKFISVHSNAKILILSRDPGLYGCWNILIQTYASGRYITNVNMDDSRAPNSWEMKIKFLDQHSNVGVVSSGVAVVDSFCTWEEYEDLQLEKKIWFQYLSYENITTNSFFQDDGQPNNFPHNSPMWRKNIHDQCGYFDLKASPYSDYHLWLKCCNLGIQFAVLPLPLEIYYLDQSSYGRDTMVDPVQDANALYAKYGGDMSVSCGFTSYKLQTK